MEIEGEGEGEGEGLPDSVLEDSLLKADDSNPTAKTRHHQPYLDLPLRSPFLTSSDTLSDVSIYSADNENQRRTGPLLTVSPPSRLLSTSPAPLPPSWKERIMPFWVSNKGLALVVLAQLFGVMMNVTTRVLEMGGSSGPGMHPFQVRPALILIFLPDTLVLSRTMTDPLCPNDWNSGPQQHLSMVG